MSDIERAKTSDCNDVKQTLAHALHGRREFAATLGDKEMRLKQLLGTILLAAASTAAATASDAQLSGVQVKSQDNAGLVTITASGAFTHTEYRPTDNLMLVDLAGVSIVH